MSTTVSVTISPIAGAASRNVAEELAKAISDAVGAVFVRNGITEASEAIAWSEHRTQLEQRAFLGDVAFAPVGQAVEVRGYCYFHVDEH